MEKVKKTQKKGRIYFLLASFSFPFPIFSLRGPRSLRRGLEALGRDLAFSLQIWRSVLFIFQNLQRKGGPGQPIRNSFANWIQGQAQASRSWRSRRCSAPRPHLFLLPPLPRQAVAALRPRLGSGRKRDDGRGFPFIFVFNKK